MVWEKGKVSPTNYAFFSEKFIVLSHLFIIILFNPINLRVYMCVCWDYTELKANLRRMNILAILNHLIQDRKSYYLFTIIFF